MLKAVIVDSNAIARGLLNSVLANGGYQVVGQTHSSAQGLALAVKFQPHIICIERDQIEDGKEVLAELREKLPKALVFMVSSALDAATIQAALARGVHGFVVKPFNADTVLKTIRNTVIAMVKKQQQPEVPAP